MLQGVVCLIAVRDGAVRVGDLVSCASSRKSYAVKEVGVMVRRHVLCYITSYYCRVFECNYYTPFPASARGF
jgi:hypothetical protein